MVVRAPSERRPLLSVDALGYGSADGERQAGIQEALIDAMCSSARSAGLNRDQWDCQKAGDGEFAVLPGSTAEKVLIDDFVLHLDAYLDTLNRDRTDDARIRLRLAIHHGVIQKAANGYAGPGAVVVNRLVESAPIRAVQRVVSTAGLVVIVSNAVFVDTIAQGFTRLRPRHFRKVCVQVKEYVETAWLYVPNVDVTAVDLDQKANPPTPVAGPPMAHQNAEVISNFHGPVQADVIGMRKS